MSFPLAYSGAYTIRTYEIDHQKRATVASLMKLMHEAAMQNVLELKLSVWDLDPHHISWVLRRQYLQLFQLPKLGQTVRILTCPAGFDRFFTYRDYYVYSDSDQLLAQSSSTWLLMDTQHRKMAPLPPFIKAYENKMEAPDAYLPRPSGKFPAFEKAVRQATFRVNWHDLDFNGHLNNTFYVQWMLEALGPEMLNAGRLKRLDILYKAECHLGAEVISEMQATADNQFLHRLRLADSETLLAVCETRF